MLPHWELLNAVRGHIAADGAAVVPMSVRENQDIELSVGRNMTFVQQYARRYAGRAVLYGICLQQQHLDPTHYPRRLNIQNAMQPFLYSLIGSWGPVMFPLAFQAFREWWYWYVSIALLTTVITTITTITVITTI